MASRRAFSILLAGALLSGCAGVGVSVSGFVPNFTGGCEKPAPGTFRGIDWAAVRQVDVRVRHGEFTPNLIRLREGGAYVMRIRNRDDGTVRFNAREFFAGIKIQRIVVADREHEDLCPGALAIPSRQVAEVRFIAERDGRYEFEDSFLPPFLTVGAAGVIIVEEPLPPMAYVQILPPAPEGIPTFPLTPAATPPAATPPPAQPATPAATPPLAPAPPPAQPAPTIPALAPPAVPPVPVAPEEPASPATLPTAPPLLPTEPIPTIPALAPPAVPPVPVAPEEPASPATLPMAPPPLPAQPVPAIPALTPPMMPPPPVEPEEPVAPAATPPATMPPPPAPEPTPTPAVAPPPSASPLEPPAERESDEKDEEAEPIEIPGLPTPPAKLFSR